MLIQGGMGVAVSDWRLARAVSQAGHLGVVSGTAVDTVVASLPLLLLSESNQPEVAASVPGTPSSPTWSRVPDDETVFGGPDGQGMGSVTVGGPGFVAVGADGDDAAVWTSVDGIRWSRVPHDEDVFGGPGGLGMSSVTAGGPGLVAVGGVSCWWSWRAS